MGLTAGYKGTILLLCSDSDVFSALRDTLENAGYVVLAGKNLGSAVDRLGECKPNLLVVCPYVDNISGHQAAVYLRTRCNGLRVLMLAGLPDDDRIVYREARGSVEIFPKPFAAAEFLGKVAALLAPATVEPKA